MDSYIEKSIDASGGTYDPDTGAYGTLVITGCADRDRAKELSSALFRCAYYMHYKKIRPVSMHTKIHQAKDGTYSVEYTVYNKAHARAAVIAKYGNDRSKWAYDPRAKGK
jgi:hypothetical protein